MDKITVETALGNITAQVLPDKEYAGIALLFEDKMNSGEPGAIMEIDPYKAIIQLRVYGKEDPDGDPVAVYIMREEKKHE